MINKRQKLTAAAKTAALYGIGMPLLFILIPITEKLIRTHTLSLPDMGSVHMIMLNPWLVGFAVSISAYSFFSSKHSILSLLTFVALFFLVIPLIIMRDVAAPIYWIIFAPVLIFVSFLFWFIARTFWKVGDA
jgi:hypothetical protein